MLRFTTTIRKFKSQGEKTGWTYIAIPASIAEKLYPGRKTSFRIKGRLDDLEVNGLALVPMGEGNFILALNAALRKKLGKREGSSLSLAIEADHGFEIRPNSELLECLADEPEALSFFYSLSRSHRDYFTKWIESAKTEATKTKRIAMSVSGLARKLSYGEMLRSFKKDNDI